MSAAGGDGNERSGDERSFAEGMPSSRPPASKSGPLGPTGAVASPPHAATSKVTAGIEDTFMSFLLRYFWDDDNALARHLMIAGTCACTMSR
jgi:hypothetical protein